MRLSQMAFTLGATILSSGFLVTSAWADHDPCKVLTAEAFSKIMGYKATLVNPGATGKSCFYQGPGKSGGQFMILTEAAAPGPAAEARLKGPGHSPPPGSGMVGGAYLEGTIYFSLSIRSSDEIKLQALVAEIRRNLK